jgi:hypothetical protein
MNTLEHGQRGDKETRGLYFGQVIGTDDPEGARRVKVRVRGLYELPVAKAHIPWAVPLVDAPAPMLGDEVGVVFTGPEGTPPWYLPASLVDRARRGAWETVYASVGASKAEARHVGVQVAGSSFDEPEPLAGPGMSPTGAVRLYMEDTAREDGEGVDHGDPQKGMVLEAERAKGVEAMSVYHPAGTFVEVHPDGDVVIHGAKDLYTLPEGSLKGRVGGSALLRINGELKLKVGGTVVLEAPSVEIRGGVLKTKGTVLPTGSGPYCALTQCVFSGTPHVGPEVTGT